MVSSYALVGDDAFVLIDPQVPDGREPRRTRSGTRSTATSTPTARLRSSSPSTSTHGAPRTSPAATTAARSGRPRTPSTTARSTALGPTPPATSCPPASGYSTPGCPASARCTCRRTRRSCSATPSSTASACSPKAGWRRARPGTDVADALRPLLDEDIELAPAHARRPRIRWASRAARARSRGCVKPGELSRRDPGIGLKLPAERRYIWSMSLPSLATATDVLDFKG